MPLILKTEWVRLKGRPKGRPRAKVHCVDTVQWEDTNKVTRTSDCGIDITDDRFEVVAPSLVRDEDYCKTCEATFVGRPK